MCVQLEDAVVLSQSVVSMGEEAAEFLPRAYLALGLCYSLKASEGKDTQTPSSHRHAPAWKQGEYLDSVGMCLLPVLNLSARLQPL